MAVLASGGVESAALLREALHRYEQVYPLYLRKGLRWEAVELWHLKKVLGALRAVGLKQLVVLEVGAAPLYLRHWSLGSGSVPATRAPDASVYLPARNLLLLTLGGVFCGRRKIPALWIGVLKGNPFQDAGSPFLRRMEGVLRAGVGFSLRIRAPLAGWTKPQVLRRWPAVPWGLTFSCVRPVGKRHCGRCQKCGERQRAFKKAGLEDPTRYARLPKRLTS